MKFLFPAIRENSPYCSLASEWDVFTELCENWNLKLKWARPLEGFPGSSAGKASTCNARDPGLITGLGRSTGEGIGYPLQYCQVSLVAQLVKNPPSVQETWVLSLGWEDPLEKGKATHSGILAWRIPWAVHRIAKS